MHVTFPVRLAAWCAVLSLLVLMALTLHVATAPVLALLCVGCAVPPFWRAPRPSLKGVPRWFLLALAPFLVYGLVNTLAPEIEADANTYHLANRIGTGEISFYERLPQAMEMLYVPAMRFGGSSAARLLHYGMLIACIPLMLGLGRRFGLSETASCCGTLLFSCAPVVQMAGASAFNDAGLALATLASVTVLVTGGPVWLAGFLAGACYGIKMTGGVMIAAGLGWLIWERRWRDCVWFLMAAAVPVAPWVMRNWIQTGNPLAPFFNAWFPNPYFHPLSEEKLRVALASYGVGFWQRFPELLWGWKLHGIIGPAFLIAPVVLWRRSWPLLALFGVLSIPWWMNAGARFLIPALPFLCLAIAWAAPSRWLVAAHLVTAFPLVLELYSPAVWHLHRFPWKVAATLESRETYLRRVSPEYHFARMISDRTKPSDLLLDLEGIHAAFIPGRRLIGGWQSAVGEQVLQSLEFARVPGGEKLFETRSRFPARPVRAIRIRQDEPANEAIPWSMVEIEAIAGGIVVGPSAGWILDAKPNRWDARLALDRNVATRWSSAQAAKRGQWFLADFGGPITLDGVRVTRTGWDFAGRVDIDVQSPDGAWATVDTTSAPLGPVRLREDAIRRTKALGFTHIVVRTGGEGIRLLGTSMAESPRAWGLEEIDSLDTVHLFAIK